MRMPIDQLKGVSAALKAAVDKLDAPGISGKVKTTLDDLHRTLARLDAAEPRA